MNIKMGLILASVPLLVVSAAFATVEAHRDEVVFMLQLNRQDSVEFAEGLKGLSVEKKIEDPEFAGLIHIKQLYQSKNGALTVGCRHTYEGEKPFQVECNIEIIPVRSTAEDVEVAVTPGGLFRIWIRDAEAATKMYQNFGMNPYSSNEQVRLHVSGMPRERSRVRVECTPTAVMSVLARQCKLEVVVN